MESSLRDIGLMLTVILLLTFLTFWIIALIRIIKNDFPGENEKLIWALLVIFLPFIGTIIYFCYGQITRN